MQSIHACAVQTHFFVFKLASLIRQKSQNIHQRKHSKNCQKADPGRAQIIKKKVPKENVTKTHFLIKKPTKKSPSESLGRPRGTPGHGRDFLRDGGLPCVWYFGVQGVHRVDQMVTQRHLKGSQGCQNGTQGLRHRPKVTPKGRHSS